MLHQTQTISKDFGMHVNTNFSIPNYWFISVTQQMLLLSRSSESLISLKQYVINVPAFYDCPLFSTSCNDMPDLFAALFDTTLVLWDLKISVSLPEFPITFFTHQASEFLDAGWCELPKLMENSVKSWVTISDLSAKYA